MEFFATSRDRTPPKDPEEDGNYIIENFKYDGGPCELRFPAILNFLEKPTLKHAKAMLKSYNIHLPLSTMLHKAAKQNPKPNPIIDLPKKGGKPQSIQYELLILDTMHDLLGSEPQTIYNIFKKEIDLSPHLKALFLRSDYSFTRDAVSHIQQKAKMTIQNATFDNKTKKACDFALASSISTWNNLTFVLDDFVAGLKNGGGGPRSQGVMILIGCAYLIVMLSNMKRFDMLPKTCQSILFVDGFFMQLDGSYISRFIVLFAKTLYRLTNLDTNIKARTLVNYASKPKYFNKLFPEAHAFIANSQININSTSYDIFPDNPLPNTIYYPHSKKTFFQHVKNNARNKDLWYLNFLRDAFKADMALETDAVFMTHDRLAFTYYKLIGGHRGFLISVDATRDEHLNEYCDYHVSF